MGCSKALKEDQQEPNCIQKKAQMVPRGLQQQPNEPKTTKVSKSISKNMVLHIREPSRRPNKSKRGVCKTIVKTIESLRIPLKLSKN